MHTDKPPHNMEQEEPAVTMARLADISKHMALVSVQLQKASFSLGQELRDYNRLAMMGLSEEEQAAITKACEENRIPVDVVADMIQPPMVSAKKIRKKMRWEMFKAALWRAVDPILKVIRRFLRAIGLHTDERSSSNGEKSDGSEESGPI